MRPDCPGALKLMAYMDGELPPTESAVIAEHIAGCPDCRSFLETQGSIEKSWRDSWQDPPDFRFNDMRRKLVRGRGHFRLPGWAIGLAAGAAAVFLGIRVFNPVGSPVLDSRILEETAALDAPPDPSVPDTLAETGSAVPLTEEMQDDAAVQPETEEEQFDELVAAGAVGSTTELDEPAPGEASLSSGEDAVFQQSQETGDLTGGVEGLTFSESPDLGRASGSGVLSGAYEMQQPAGGGGCAVAAEETEPSATIETFNSSQTASARTAVPDECRDMMDTDAEKAVTLLCERYDGAPVSPWKELCVFVDSLLQSRSSLPAMFNIDPLGFTVEQDGIPRVWLGVDDPAIVPLTVRVLFH